MIQKAFFSNSQNNQKFIDLLTVPLEADHHTVAKCTGYCKVFKSQLLKNVLGEI